jgi:hypothetical protein
VSAISEDEGDGGMQFHKERGRRICERLLFRV